MAIVNNYIRLGFLIWNDPEAAYAMTDDLLEEYRALEVSMSKQPKSEERIRDPFREEHSTYTGGNLCEGVADTPNDNVLKDGCIAGEGRAFAGTEIVSFIHKLKR